jgi:hypothetical protein
MLRRPLKPNVPDKQTQRLHYGHNKQTQRLRYAPSVWETSTP